MRSKEALLAIFVIVIGVFTTLSSYQDSIWASEAKYGNEGYEKRGSEYIWTETFTLDGSNLNTASLETVNGFIHVEAQEGDPSNEVYAQAEIRMRPGWFFSNERKVIEAKKYIGLLKEVNNGRLRIKGDLPKRTPGVSNVVINLTIKMPSNLKTDAHTVNGNVESKGLLAPLVIETVNGQVITKGCPGPIQAGTVNGNIRLESVKAPVKAELVNGNIQSTFHSMPEDSSHFSSVNGNVELSFPAEAGMDLDLSTVNGSVQFDHNGFSGEAKKKHVKGTLRGGGAAIHVETVNGNVKVRS